MPSQTPTPGKRLSWNSARTSVLAGVAAQLSPSAGAKELERYAADPIGFTAEVLNVHPWGVQRDILNGLNHERARVTVRACHGSGKTWTAAAAGTWFLTTGPDSVLITTAPTARQVEEILWRELRQQVKQALMPLPGRLLDRDPRWEIGEKWFGLGLSTDQPERFQGFHARRVLVIEDEASGVPDTIHAAIEGVLSSGDARLLLIGNPTQTAGHFHASFHRARETYTTITISAFDTPNFTGEGDYPMLVSPAWVGEKRTEWGEESDLWRVRVLGEFPRGTLDTVVALADLETARIRQLEAAGTAEIGVDVARFGDDRTVLVKRRGPVVVSVEIHQQRDTVFVAGRAKALADEEPDPKRVPTKVDDGGVGGGVTDQIKANGYNAQPVNADNSAIDAEKYPNRRSELWFATAERAKDGDLDLSRLPQDVYDTLVAELTAPKWKMDSRGRRVVEPKADFKKRLTRSPDLADALNLAFAPGVKRLTLPSLVAGGVSGWNPTR